MFIKISSKNIGMGCLFLPIFFFSSQNLVCISPFPYPLLMLVHTLKNQFVKQMNPLNLQACTAKENHNQNEKTIYRLGENINK